MTKHSRFQWSSLIRYGVCIAAVSWIVYRTEWSELKQVWREADRLLLLISVLLFGPAPVLIALRLKWLLAVHNVHLTFWQAVKVTFAGNFIISALPVGTTGGDSVKAYYIARDTPHKHEAVTTVFFDRVIGVSGLILLAGLMTLLNWRNPAFTGWGQTIGILVLCLAIGAAIYFSRRARRFFRLDAIVARLPLAAHFQRIDQAAFAFRGAYRRVLACLALSIVLQVIGIVSLFFAGWALGIIGGSPFGTFPVYLGYVPICYLTGVLPIGVMEETFNQLFVGIAGLGTLEAAVSLSLFSRIIQLIWALPGSLLVLRRRSFLKTDALLEESQTKVDTLA